MTKPKGFTGQVNRLERPHDERDLVHNTEEDMKFAAASTSERRSKDISTLDARCRAKTESRHSASS